MPSFLTDSWDSIEKVFGINGHTTANTTGMNASQSRVATTAATISNVGLITSVFGGINSAIGAFYAAKTAQYQEESTASSLQFQSGMDAINAREAENSAQSILESGKTQVQQYTMRERQQESATQVSTAARGVDLTSGSAVQQRASDSLVKQLDVLTINANAVRAASTQRTQATNYSNESLLAQAGAQNARTSAGTISPGFAATTSLLGSASNVASQWDYRRKLALATQSTP